jgi:hypothetical protein
MENVGTFNGHLGYYMVIWYVIWSFDIFYCHWVNFLVVWYIFLRFALLSNKNLSALIVQTPLFSYSYTHEDLSTFIVMR